MGESCRSLLNEIRSFSFLVEDNEGLMKETLNILEKLRDRLLQNLPQEQGIPLLKNENKKVTNRKGQEGQSITLRSTQGNNKHIKFTTIPNRKRKNIFTNRVGMKKEKQIKASQIDISEMPMKEGDINITEEIITDELDYNNVKEFQTDINRNIELKGALITHPPKEEPVDVTPQCSLGYSDMKDISDSRMLSDNVVNAFQKMMEKQFPEANGLQDPILGQTLSFKVQKNKPFVQVLHDGKLHWKPISTYGCNEGEVCYIDSLFKGRIADHTKQQICAILHCDLKHVKIKVLPVQQQRNGVDCGVFALAFCFHILSEKANPVGIFFDESNFRHHLLHCLTANLISPFPKSNGQAMKTCKDREIMVEIFCTCRMPWRKAENNIYAKQMVECSKCGEWFHRMCELIPEDIFKKQNSKIEWLCRSCSNSK